MKVAVLGAGAWGTALAKVLHENGHAVTLWARNAEALADIQRTRRNERYLPGVELPSDWLLEPDVSRAIADKSCIVVAVPSKGFRAIAQSLTGSNAALV